MVSGLRFGKVTRANAEGVWVKMQASFPGVEFGPLPILANGVIVGPYTTSSALSGAEAHTHTVAKKTEIADQITAGDTVLVAEVTRDDFIVLGKVRKGVSS